MGYSIYYNRAFIRVGDQFVPLVCSGASNGADRVGGRWVPEKDWSVLNWKRRDRVLFSEAEIREIAKDYEHNLQGMSFKSRYKPFAPGEFEKWIIGGMNRARTIEEYNSVGNTIQVVDYPNGMIEHWRRQPFATDEELLTLLSQFSTGQEFDISFNDRDLIRPPARKTQGRGHESMADEFAPFTAILGGTGAAPAEKQSVLKLIADAREQGGAPDKPKPGNHRKSCREEL